ncbi:hypothetical protein PCANC_06078 [Puccinia coronata f. sp. avenae]|uniref:Uncharacterized protein n=1 Tax=Puccinia coronata f. sp. avenae TaxID=200324 RepID=A0A2N5VTU1_9BASI|nr:hypothetical protein PCANC_06078 [Puccinia coronata f. sp. avenae]
MTDLEELYDLVGRLLLPLALAAISLNQVMSSSKDEETMMGKDSKRGLTSQRSDRSKPRTSTNNHQRRTQLEQVGRRKLNPTSTHLITSVSSSDPNPFTLLYCDISCTDPPISTIVP